MPRLTRSRGLSVVLCVCCITPCFEYVYATTDCPINETPDVQSLVGSCTACEAGTYKNTTGSEACTPDGWVVADIGGIYSPAMGLGFRTTLQCAQECDAKLTAAEDGTSCFAFWTHTMAVATMWNDVYLNTICYIINTRDWVHEGVRDSEYP
jgi:hypothetical protein